MRWRKLKSAVNGQGIWKQSCVKQTGVKQGFGLYVDIEMILNNIVGIMTSLRAGKARKWVDSGQGKRLSFLRNVQTNNGTYPFSYSVDTGGIFPGNKLTHVFLAPRLGMNGAIPPIHIYLYGVHKDRLAFVCLHICIRISFLGHFQPCFVER